MKRRPIGMPCGQRSTYSASRDDVRGGRNHSWASPGARGLVSDEQLSAAVERNELVADRFSQQLEGSFGQRLARDTPLLDFQPEQLIQMVDQGHLVQRAEQRREIGTGLAVVLMLGLVLALYIVLNELTKGYFVWNLRAAAMLALLTMVVVFCWWIG